MLRIVCQRELDVVSAIATSGGLAADRRTAAVKAFASRAVRGRRLAYAIIVEPVDPEVDQVRLEYRRPLTGRLRAHPLPPAEIVA